ncbi:MAG: hypothetical protein IJ676_05355, partial [Clostridia bacterium]|nr:hypothetical protein [Clostridia bacterium]
MQPIDYSNESRDTLYLLPLPQLRLIGRDLGVRSPTSLKKEQLLEEICSILDYKKKLTAAKNNDAVGMETEAVVKTEEEEQDNNKNGGRPPKNWSKIIFNDVDRANELKARNVDLNEGFAVEDSSVVLDGVLLSVDDAFVDYDMPVSSKGNKQEKQ